jgi:tRNA uridine 5-carbamoylmethylation protein Kti12
MSVNNAIIMRGIPGSGKSTLAKTIASGFGLVQGNFVTENNVTYFVNLNGTKISAIHLTDEYFMKNGVYSWNQYDIYKNHNANFDAFCKSMDNGIPVVICDNTNSMKKEFNSYKVAAKDRHYNVSFCELPHPSLQDAVNRNTHNVPSDVIDKMIKRWESSNK